MTKEADKTQVREAMGAYVQEFGPDIPMSDLRSYVRDKTSLDFGGPALAALLKPLGYVRDRVRRIDSCPGQTVFYVKAAD